MFDLSITHERYGSSSHPLQNGKLRHLQDIDAPLHIAAQCKINSYRQQLADNQNVSFSPPLSAPPPACTATFYQSHGILPVAEEQSRSGGGQSGGITDQPQCRWLWHSRSPSARSLSRSPFSPPPSFTQSPSPPRSLVRDGPTSPHRPRLVVSCSTCPPLSPSPHANSFIIGTAVINTP